MSDNEIIDLYLKRDESAIERTDEKYGAYCKRIAYNILADEFDAEECKNDTYFKLWCTIPPTVPKFLSAFIARIARNAALDKYRVKSREKRGRIDGSLDELGEFIGEENTVAEIAAKELGELITLFLRGESEKARKIFVRRYFYEESIADIAKFYAMTESNVKTTLSRTRAELAEYLRGEEVII